MKLFATPQAIRSEIESMERAETHRREDRATVSSFFNGEAPLSDEEAEDLGLSINVNHLFGYTEINSSKKQLFSLYTKPTRLFAIEIDSCPPHVRRKWEMEGAAAMNDLIKETGRLKHAYEGVSGDAALHGTGVFTFPNATDWCPDQTSLSRLLVPDDAPADPRKLVHWSVETTLSLRDIHRYVKSKSGAWKTGNLSKILRHTYKDIGSAVETNFDGDYNAEELEYRRQANSDQTNRRRPSVRVNYFYQARPDKKGSPVDVTIMLHRGETLGTGSHEKISDTDRVLFEKEGCYCSVEDVIHPFFMDCILGGTPMWHRVLGLGHLNYQLNHAVELLLNRAMQGTLEGMMNLWQAKDSASREEIQRVLLRHNGVVPENVQLLQQRYSPDLSGSLAMIQYYRQQGSRNARGVAPGDKGDQLQVQAQWEQGMAAEETSATMSNWYDYLDRLGAKMWERLVNPWIQPSDAGYSEIKKFQSRLERVGIPLFCVQPHNVKVTAARIVGDGNAQKEQVAANFLMQNRAAFGPKAQQEITRTATAVFTGSYALAERLVPEDERPDPSAVADAQNESNTCILQGKPPEVGDNDIDEVHVPTHLDAMIGIVQQGSQNGATFTPEQLIGFQALGAHIVMHIRKKESMVAGAKDQNKALARQWMQMLNEVVSVGEQMAHNLQEKQQSQGAELDPAKVAELQLKAQQLQLNADKFEFSREKWLHQQNAKENTTAFNQAMDIQRSHREDLLARNKAAANDVKSAATLAQLNAPTSTE